MTERAPRLSIQKQRETIKHKTFPEANSWIKEITYFLSQLCFNCILTVKIFNLPMACFTIGQHRIRRILLGQNKVIQNILKNARKTGSGTARLWVTILFFTVGHPDTSRLFTNRRRRHALFLPLILCIWYQSGDNIDSSKLLVDLSSINLSNLFLNTITFISW